MNEWQESFLNEVIEIIGGGTPKTSKEDYWSGNIPWLSVVDFGNGNRWVSKTEKNITEEGLKNSSTKLLDAGDLIISARGTVGELAQLSKTMAFNQSCYGIRAKAPLSNGYLYYLLKYSLQKLRKNTHGSVFSTITRDTFENIDIRYPKNKNEIDKIENSLSCLDSKIDNLQKQNQTLEKIAQTLFKQWFVDFNFPDENGKPYKDNGGEMVGSELKKIPMGWRIGTLREISDKISKGTTPKKKDVEGLIKEIPFLKVKDISNDGLIKLDSLESIPQEIHYNELSRSKLETNDILFSIAGTIGRVAIVSENLNNSNCNQAIAFIRLSSKDFYLEFVHQWIKSSAIQFEIKSNIVQGVQANVSLTVLGNLLIIIPVEYIMIKWNEFIKPIYQKLENNIVQIQNLTKTRDILLPKLMSGQIRIKD